MKVVIFFFKGSNVCALESSTFIGHLSDIVNLH